MGAAAAAPVAAAVPVPGTHAERGSTPEPEVFDIASFMPHGHCYLWQPGILWTHVISDTIVGLAYFSIPLALLYYKVRARHAGPLLNSVLWMFMAFIVLCGLTHFVSIWTVWQPVYQFEGLLKAMTALVSIGVAITLWPLMPRALAIPSPDELRQVNDELDRVNASLALRVEQATGELRRQAEDLSQANAELRRSNADLDDFARVASHDLRSPLRGIDNLARWIGEDYRSLLPRRARRDLETLRGRIRRMENLLEGLLAYSQVGREQRAPEPVDLDAVVAELDEMLDKPAPFTIERRGDLPVIPACPAPLQTVIRNLVDNAIKHRARDDGRVVIACEDRGDHYRIAVSDDGPGIPARYRDSVFGLFKTLQSRDQTEGSGIGLTLVKRIVETQGGSIEAIDSEAFDDGLTVAFTWPKTALERCNRATA